MKFKDILKNNPFTVLLILVAACFSGITIMYSYQLAIVEIILIIILVICNIKQVFNISERKKMYLRYIEDSLKNQNEIGDLTSAFPFPFVLVDKKCKIQWFNKEFHEIIDLSKDKYSDNILTFIPQCANVVKNKKANPFDVNIQENKYTVYPAEIKEGIFVFYFINDTILKDIKTKFDMTRPAVMLINVDSLDYTEDTLNHADYSSVVSDLEKIISKWLVEYNCIFRKFADGKFFAVTENVNIDKIISDNFSIMKIIREYRFNEDEIDVTLSIGIGRDEDFCNCEVSARKALDMARGRGGDQVAMKIGENYDFFGGLTDGKEKRGKVKSRIISAALFEFIEKCDNVFVMGHSYSDFDALGAAVGVSAIAKAAQKKCYIVVNKKTTLAMPLIEMIKNTKNNISFISPEKAEGLFDNNSLLVITDTMRSKIVEAPLLLRKANNIILIDHHRKSVDYINNAVLAFHEPYASSTCEMVTELIQYSPVSIKLSAVEAQCLLAGIILDTKNYTLRVGVRTFEAAAFLRDCKTDTVAVKKLFSGSVEEKLQVSKLISSAEFFNNYCIVAVKEDINVSRLVASKTADELLNIEGVDASFVITTANETINISARSLGVMNVQLIMEAFGGGGHQSMAACQISNTSLSDVVKKLHEIIAQYNEKKHKT